MSAELERSRQLAAQGEYKKAVSTLWRVEAIARTDEAEAIALRELAATLSRQTNGRIHSDCMLLIDRAQESLDRMNAQKQAVLVNLERQAGVAGAIAVVLGCKILGGHGYPVQIGQTCDLVFLEEEIRLRRGETVTTIGLSEVMAIEIGGPGESTSGGGFIGGGFGVQGAAEGMLIASALNLLTTRSRIDTVVCLQTRTAELFLWNGAETPTDLRMRLSPVFSKLRQLANAPAPAIGDSRIDQLTKLGSLLERGLIDDEEFQTLKSSILAS